MLGAGVLPCWGQCGAPPPPVCKREAPLSAARACALVACVRALGRARVIDPGALPLAHGCWCSVEVQIALTEAMEASGDVGGAQAVVIKLLR